MWCFGPCEREEEGDEVAVVTLCYARHFAEGREEMRFVREDVQSVLRDLLLEHENKY
jgi:hypothetical protein